MPLIKLQNVHYTYPGREKPALKGIQFSVNKGEYVAIVGKNGSGKSTLTRIIAGFATPSKGSVILPSYSAEKNKTLSKVPVGIVFQNPRDQVVATIVERDTAFGPQNLGLSKGEIEMRTIECLSAVSLTHKAFSRTNELSLGQTQRVAFSGIMALFPQILLLDEVCAMLDPAARAEILTFLARWHARGATILHITHDADELMCADRVLALENGTVAFDGLKEDFFKKTELFKSILPTWKSEPFIAAQNISSKEISLVASGLSFSYTKNQVFNGLSLTLRRGSLTALMGPSGCGKSTLFDCLSLLKECEGTLYASSRPLLCLQESEAALFERCAADDVAFGPSANGIKGNELLERVKNAMQKVGLPYETFADRPTSTLSGGEKRKLAIAGILALDGEILIFDEPTSALDAPSRIAVLKLLRSLALEGKTVLFSTHHEDEAQQADSVLRWDELCKANTPVEKIPPNLKKMAPSKNAALLKKIDAIGKSVSTPSKIPPSFISKRPPLVKVLLFLLLFILPIASNSALVCTISLALSVLYALLARFPLKKPLRSFIRFMPLLLLFAILQLLMVLPDDSSALLFSVGFLSITQAKLLLCLSLFIRVLSLLITIGTFIFSIEEKDLLLGLEYLLFPLALIKIPVRYIVLVLGIIFRFLPILMEELTGILKTQIVRGVFGEAKGLKRIKLFIPLVVPLLIQSIKRAERLSEALTARYYH